ncbi:hypothetical protein AAGR08_03100 [Pantoea sp. BRR-3P]
MYAPGDSRTCRLAVAQIISQDAFDNETQDALDNETQDAFDNETPGCV